MKKMNLCKLAAAIAVSVASVSAQAASYSGEGIIDSSTPLGGFFGLAVGQEVLWGIDIDDSVIGSVSTGDISGDYSTDPRPTANGARFIVWNSAGTAPVVPMILNGSLGLLSSTLTVDGSDITGGSLAFYANAGTGQQSTIDIDFDAGTFDIYAGTAIDVANLGGSGTITVNGVNQSPSAVPVPAAAWLFGSALVGLAGVGRKRAA